MENALQLRKKRINKLLLFFGLVLVCMTGCKNYDEEPETCNLIADIKDSIKNYKAELKFKTPVMWTDFSETYIQVYQFEPMTIGLAKDVSIKRDDQDNEFIEMVRFNYTIPMEEIIRQKNEVEIACSHIIDGINKCNSDQEKVDLIIENLISDFEYDDLQEDSNSIYSALCKKQANCQGISKAFFLLCNRSGIKVGYCIGKLDGYPHMWNYVFINDQKTQVDVLGEALNIDEKNRVLDNYVEYE